ncbi:hypothetical protein [Candidatus Williamhamiltonella defendens]|uniref:Uncharacterized protein n=1 Tax=Candidatus Williamhamiltonella defendens TaxID=138072 RepID=A0A2D3TH47_9ENTR|nr:hypothetical protein [Candidatus Hamiltonella defensa]ATW34811.1 hypothetical protein BJP43_10480 [Candidatus Hamiltonella defensa]
MKLSEKRNKIFTRKIGNEDLRSIKVAKPRMIFPQKNEVQKYIEEEKRDIESKKSITGPGYINNSYREYVRTASASHPSTSSAIDIPSTSTKTPISNTAAATSAAEKRASISSTSTDKIPITTKLFIRAVVAELEELELYEEKNKWQKITKTEEITPLCENILKILENDSINHQKTEQATRRAVKNLREHLKYSVTPESISKETNQAVSTAVVKKTTKTPSKTTLSNCYAASAILSIESLEPHQPVAKFDVSDTALLEPWLMRLKNKNAVQRLEEYFKITQEILDTCGLEDSKRLFAHPNLVKEAVCFAGHSLNGGMFKDAYLSPLKITYLSAASLAQEDKLPNEYYSVWTHDKETFSPTRLLLNIYGKDYDSPPKISGKNDSESSPKRLQPLFSILKSAQSPSFKRLGADLNHFLKDLKKEKSLNKDHIKNIMESFAAFSVQHSAPLDF